MPYNGPPGKRQIIKYAILYILSESREGKTCHELSYLCGYAERDLLPILSSLLTRNDIKTIKDDNKKTYTLTKAGASKLKYFKENRDYQNYWKPPWEH